MFQSTFGIAIVIHNFISKKEKGLIQVFDLNESVPYFQRLDPTWDGPKKQEENLLKYLDKISTLIELKVNTR